MKTLMIAASAACALLAVPAMAQAQEPSYYGTIGYGGTHMNLEEVDIETDTGAIEGRVGYQLSKNVAFEGELAFGVADDTVEYAGDEYTVKLNFQAGAFVRLSLPVSERVDLFGRLGYIAADGEVEDDNGDAYDFVGGDYAIGVGAQVFFTANDGLRADYTRRGSDVSTWSVAYVRKF